MNELMKDNFFFSNATRFPNELKIFFLNDEKEFKSCKTNLSPFCLSLYGMMGQNPGVSEVRDRCFKRKERIGD